MEVLSCVFDMSETKDEILGVFWYLRQEHPCYLLHVMEKFEPRQHKLWC